MKTDYTQELQQLITDWYRPVPTQEAATKTTVHKTLNDIYEDVTNILPAKWVDQSDVYQALSTLGFKPFYHKEEEKSEQPPTFYYYLEPL